MGWVSIHRRSTLVFLKRFSVSNELHEHAINMNEVLFFFGLINLVLGLAWNEARYKRRRKYSIKYSVIWILGLVEILTSVIHASL